MTSFTFSSRSFAVVLSMAFPILSFTSMNAAVPHPIYINQAEIDAIKVKVQASQQPWLGGYNSMIAAANSVKTTPYASIPVVTDNGGEGNAHVYKSAPPYLSDGVPDPNADRTDYNDAIAVGKAVRNLGLAYRFTGDTAYAAKAVEYIRRFCLDSATYLAPQYTNSTQCWIEVSITIPGIIYGASLIEDYSGWPAAEKTAFATWVSSFYDSAGTWSQSQNFDDWRLAFRSVCAAYLGDTTKLAWCDTRFKQRVGGEAINAQGQLWQELSRTKSLSYSTYALNALTLTAEIGRHCGYDWYHYTANGRSLKLAYDYHAPYVANPTSWPYEQISPYVKNDNNALYELAYSQFQAPSYLTALNYWGRPFEETRHAGWVTLTHANLFALGTTPAVPAAPSGLAATSVSHTQINLAWNDNSTNETGFKIERKTGAGAYAEIALVGAGVKTFSNTGLGASTAYSYRVRSTNSGGNSAYSSEATATTQATPPPASSPNGVTISGYSSQGAGYEAIKAIDGIDNDDNNRWSANAAGYPQWIEVDLGSEKRVSGTTVVSIQGRDYRFLVEAKKAGGTYQTVVDRTANTQASPMTDVFPTVLARYVKLTVTGAFSYTGNIVSIREFKVAYSPIVIATSSQKVDGEGWRVSDGNETTSGWSSLVAGYPQWIELDLGSDQPISGTTVVSYQGRAYRFFVEAKSAGGTYQSIVDRNSSTQAGPIADTFPTVTARYVKLTVTGAFNYTGNWVSISEFKITSAPTAVARSSDQPNLEAWRAVDGIDEGSGWSSGTPGYPQWIEIDLGRDTSINGTYLVTASNRAYQFRIEAKAEGGVYQTIVDRTTSTQAGPISDAFSPRTARFLKLTVTGAHNYTGNWVSIPEFKVSRMPALAAVSSEQDGNEAANALDGIDNNDNNRWSAQGYPQWLEVDLGYDRSVSGTTVVSYLGRAYRFKVEAKKGDGIYQTVVDRTASTQASPIADTFAPVRARYVKLTVTGAHNYSATPPWVSIREFKVTAAP